MLQNKLGLSTIVATLLLVLLTVVLAGIVWGVVAKMTKDNLNKSQSCFEIFNKVKLDERYTCYNVSSPNKELIISLAIKDIDVDEVTIGVSYNGETKSFKILKTLSQVPNVRYYNGTINVALPSKNSGVAYAYDFGTAFGTTNFPDSIEVAPMINGNQCEISSSIQEIGSC
jgi:FlaG/FlaF family flagellin (archaellin)